MGERRLPRARGHVPARPRRAGTRVSPGPSRSPDHPASQEGRRPARSSIPRSASAPCTRSARSPTRAAWSAPPWPGRGPRRSAALTGCFTGIAPGVRPRKIGVRLAKPTRHRRVRGMPCPVGRRSPPAKRQREAPGHGEGGCGAHVVPGRRAGQVVVPPLGGVGPAGRHGVERVVERDVVHGADEFSDRVADRPCGGSAAGAWGYRGVGCPSGGLWQSVCAEHRVQAGARD